MKCWNLAFNACTRFNNNYSSCTSKSSEDICNKNGSAQEIMTQSNSIYCKTNVFLNFTPLECSFVKTTFE